MMLCCTCYMIAMVLVLRRLRRRIWDAHSSVLSSCIELCTQYPSCNRNTVQCNLWCIRSKSSHVWLSRLEGGESRVVPSRFQI